MQMADGRHDGQAQAVTGKAPAPIETVESGYNLRSFLGWDAQSIVLYDDRHVVSPLRRSNLYSGRPSGVLQRVVDQICGRAGQQILVAYGGWFAIDIDDQLNPVCLCGGIV